ncbi:MAG TPA: DNA mismatch repair endonuclease MutL [Desulfobacteraceae bacterium]|nr:DNA mismatch repair endonuclease MutL [Desulfobacteraceae bacterium]
MNTIRILPERVASQIAAGEVVDRPASVVRELIDNSIDGGAERIVVTIENGGKRLVKVGDNGVGMSRDDLLLCLERNATSKIETASDLLSVKTLGFRGEAIPSIASVSRMQIVSRTQDILEGHRLRVAGGKLISIEEAGAPVGTTVEVRNLFFNIPARRKFLRAAKTETGHIVDIISRAGLPFPGISFRLTDGDKTVLNFSASDKQIPRLSALMGSNVARSIVEVEEISSELDITAYLAPSEMSRTRGDRLFIYVNGRNVRDRLVTKAIMEGYGQRLMKGQYPQAVVFLSIDPSKVDVNVHPTKQEIRFHNSRAVFQKVVYAVEKALPRSFPVFPGQGWGKDKWEVNKGEEVGLVSESVWSYSQKMQGAEAPPKAGERDQTVVKVAPEIIGQLGNTYILCQVSDGLLMVDQHAAHERIVYENLKKGFNASQLEVQNMLVPYKLELTMKEKRIVLEKGEDLYRFGIELDHFGGNTFLLRSVPALLTDTTWDSFISELIAGLEEGELDGDALMDNVLTIMACHGAIRAGQHLTNEEITRLFAQLEEMDLPTNCPHGRPIFKHFSYYEIEKMFKRVV